MMSGHCLGLNSKRSIRSTCLAQARKGQLVWWAPLICDNRQKVVIAATIMAEVAALLIHIERKAVGSMKPSMRWSGRVPWLISTSMNIRYRCWLCFHDISTVISVIMPPLIFSVIMPPFSSKRGAKLRKWLYIVISSICVLPALRNCDILTARLSALRAILLWSPLSSTARATIRLPMYIICTPWKTTMVNDNRILDESALSFM